MKAVHIEDLDDFQRELVLHLGDSGTNIDASV